MSRLHATLLALLLGAPAPCALAWSGDGHRVVAQLAAGQLRPKATAEAQRLLAGEIDPTLPGVANWADQLRESGSREGRRSQRWHFVNFKGGDCRYAPARDCPDGDCVIAAINRSFLALADRERPDSERRDALKWLVHLVGDVHQPLHATARDDRGGGDFQVAYHGKGRNLHNVWDGLVLHSSGLAWHTLAAQLAAGARLPPDPTSRSDRPAVDWSVESCRIAERIYPPTHVIGDDYLRDNLPLVEMRLQLAGKRLAGMLNHALDPRVVPAAR